MGCFICGQDNPAVLQEHHVVPQRFGGSDADENLTTLCASCHQAVEKMYNKRFYEQLGVSKGEPNWKGELRGIAKATLKHAQSEEELYESEFGNVKGDLRTRSELGAGERAGHICGYKDACEKCADILESNFDHIDVEELELEIAEESKGQDESDGDDGGEEIKVESPE